MRNWHLSPVQAAWMAGALLLASAGVQAAQDYEFGKALIDRNSPSFSTEDLVERFLAKLSAKPESQGDALMVKAYQCKRQARSGSAEKRQKLLDQVDGIYKEFTTKFPQHRLKTLAETEWASMGGERVKTLLAAADETEKEGKAADAAKLRNQAATVSGKIADQHKATADAAYPKFVTAYKTFKTWMDANGSKDPMPPVPPNILTPIDKTFDEWVVADKRYVVAKAEQLDCYDANAPERKQLSAELAKLCQARAEGITDEKNPHPENEAITNFPTLVSFYYFVQGRALAAVGTEDKATEAWKAALTQDMLNPTPDQVKQMKAIQWSVLNDLVMMKVKLKKYADAVNILEEAFMNPKYQPFFDTDGGKAILLRFADAQVSQADATAENWERAIGRLRDALVKESPRSQWANEFSRKIGELLIEARTKNARPRLPAAAWFDAAHGLFLDAQAEHMIYNENKESKKESDIKRAQEAYAQAADKYRNALFYYREVIRKVRQPGANIIERLQLEPKAWFEMGLAYVKMEDYLEACIAYQALRNNFLPDYRANWMPKPESFPQKKYPKALEEALTELDKPKDGWLARGTKNLQIIVDENIRVHKGPWHTRLRGVVRAELAAVTGGLKIDDEKMRSDKDYLAAIVDMEAGGSLVQQAKAVKDPLAAEEPCTQALKKYIAAAEKYQKVPKTSTAYGLALYQAGSCYALAEGFWSTGRFPSKKVEDVAREAPPLARKAIECFQNYEEYIAKNPTKVEEEETLRGQLQGMIMLARSSLFATLAREAQDAYAKKSEEAGKKPDDEDLKRQVDDLKRKVIEQWTQVVNGTEAFMKSELASAPGGGQDVAQLNKFRALIELSAKHLAPDCEPFLVKAEDTMKKLRTLKPKDNSLYVFMLNALSRRYLVAAFQAGDPKINLGNAKVDAYEVKVAELQSTRVTMIEEDPTEVPTLEDYTRVFYIFYRAGQKRQAADWASERIFKKFDAEGKCAKWPDNDKTRWEALLTRMETVCDYEDLSKKQRAKKDHGVLVDYMYDTPEGLSYAENIEKRPAYDRYSQDLDKALAQVKTIEKNYPDCKTLNPQYGQNKIPLVGMVAEEIDFRRKLRAVRELVMSLALEVGGELEQDAATKDAAQKYKEIAFEQVKVLSNVLGATPKMDLMKGELAFATGKFDEALETYEGIRDTVPKESQLYFDARKRIAKVYLSQKKWRDAADYPEFIVLTAGLDSKLVRESWPDIKAFLKQCYDGGLTPSKEIQKALEEKAAPPAVPGETKEEEKKEGATPGGETKKEEKAPETGPAAGEKKEAPPAGEPKGETKKETPAGAGETKSEEKAAPPAPNPPAATPTAKEEGATK